MANTGPPLYILLMEPGQSGAAAIFNEAVQTINANIASGSGGGLSIEGAQDAIGAMLDATLVYDDALPSLGRAAVTGDILVAAGSNAAAIAAGVVTYAKLQAISAAARLLGSSDAGPGAVQEITLGAGLTMTGTTLLVVLPDNSVTYAKLQDVSAAARLLGRGDGGAGDPQEITLGAGLTMTGTTLSSSGGAGTTGRHTLWFPAGALLGAKTSGATAGQVETSGSKNNWPTLTFPDTGGKVFAHFHYAFPKAWDRGTLTFQPVWTLNSTATTGVVLGLQAVAVGDGDALDSTYGTAQEVTDNGLGTTAYRVHTAPESSALTVAGSPSVGTPPAVGDVVDFRFYRDSGNAADTLSGVAVELLGLRLFYTTNANTDV